MLDFRTHTFLTVCKYMNLTKAAGELNITQPAVTQHIHCLEEHYGCRLFLHEGKKTYLTPAGRLLLSTLTTRKNDEKLLMEQMKHLSPDQAPLRFGVTMTIGEYVIAAPLSRYLKLHPDTDIHVKYANTARLLDNLKEGEISFALVEGYLKSVDYETMPYCTAAYIPVCRRDHVFADKKEPALLKDLLSERLLLRESGSGTRDILEKNLAVKNIEIHDFYHIVEVENMHTIVELLLADCGISFLYRVAVQKELDSGALCEIPLEDFNMTHDFTFIWNKGSAFDAHYREICGELSGLLPT